MSFDGRSAATLATLLDLPRVELFDRVGSTQDVAHALADGGALSGTLILADAQTAGRGRLGRSWESQAGKGIWLTLIERPTDRLALDVLSIRIGLAAAAALDAYSAGSIRLKWPNDLYGAAGKLGGILIETRWRDERVDWLAIGLGLNVHPPDGVRGEGLGSGVSRIELLQRLVPAMRTAVRLTGHLDATEVDSFTRRDLARGLWTIAPVEGRVYGISADGAVMVETVSGCQAVRSGSLILEGDL